MSKFESFTYLRSSIGGKKKKKTLLEKLLFSTCSFSLIQTIFEPATYWFNVYYLTIRPSRYSWIRKSQYADLLNPYPSDNINLTAWIWWLTDSRACDLWRSALFFSSVICLCSLTSVVADEAIKNDSIVSPMGQQSLESFKKSEFNHELCNVSKYPRPRAGSMPNG